MERSGDRPKVEAVVALAGPAVNLVGALLLGAVWALWPSRWLRMEVGLNLAIAVFNLLPVFPMDGGRVLRAALWSRMDFVRATRLAARVGRALALAMIVIGLAHNVMLVVIGAFVFVSATAEEQYVALRALLARWSAGSAVDERWIRLREDETPPAAAARMLLQGSSYGLVFAEGSNRPCGEVVPSDLEAPVLPARGEGVGGGRPVRTLVDVMRGPLICLDEHETLARASDEMARGTRVCVMTAGGVPLGLVTQERILEVVTLHRAVEAGQAISTHRPRRATGLPLHPHHPVRSMP
jgi:CBS domain-containing protein